MTLDGESCCDTTIKIEHPGARHKESKMKNEIKQRKSYVHQEGKAKEST